jgi:hypothetical protein
VSPAQAAADQDRVMRVICPSGEILPTTSIILELTVRVEPRDEAA